MATTHPLAPGERYGLGDSGWPPATIVRDPVGRYFVERLTHDLRSVRREEITAEDAAAWVEQDADR